MKKYIYLIIITILFSCNSEKPVVFSELALNDIFLDTKGNELRFAEILNSNKGKNIIIDIWASWCRDCIVGLPELKDFQDTNKDISFVFLSLDRSVDSWKAAMAKYNLDGQHYYMKSGWDGDFGEFIDLDWIPRYMVVSKDGTISQFKSIRVNDINILDKLN